MQGDGDAHLVYEFEYSEVLDKDCVGTDLVEVGEVFAQRGQLLVADEVVERHVEFDVVRVCVVDGILETRIVKVKVALVQTHIEMFAAEIDGIRTRCNACGHGIPCARRSKQFDGFSV